MHYTNRSPSHSPSISLLLLLLTVVALVTANAKELPKRSLDDSSIAWAGAGHSRAAWPSVPSGAWSGAGGHGSLGIGPSANEVAHAISAAKQASANVQLAQQRLAASKAAVAHQQRIAAALAATALQHSAHAAAAEIQKAEYEAAKFGHFIRNGHAGAAHHLTLVKDAAFSPHSTSNNHLSVSNLESLGFGPWTLSGNSNSAGKAANGWY